MLIYIMDKIWNSCTGSNLSGYYTHLENTPCFKIFVYSISKPTVYKICLYDIQGECSVTLFQGEKEGKKTVKAWMNEYPIRYELFQHKNMEFNLSKEEREEREENKEESKEQNLFARLSLKIRSPRNSPQSSPRSSPKGSPKTGSSSLLSSSGSISLNSADSSPSPKRMKSP
jgi:hypothetical protein